MVLHVSVVHSFIYFRIVFHYMPTLYFTYAFTNQWTLAKGAIVKSS